MISKELIAPCGMNCAVCKAHLRDLQEKNYCGGCNNNPVYLYCQKCVMRNCKDKVGAWKLALKVKGCKDEEVFETQEYNLMKEAVKQAVFTPIVIGPLTDLLSKAEEFKLDK